MEDWLIKDYEIRCYNLQNRLTPYEAELSNIKKAAKKIAKERKCDILTALKILKKQLENKLKEEL